MTWQWEHTLGLLWLLIIPAAGLLAWQSWKQRDAEWTKAGEERLLNTWRPVAAEQINSLLLVLFFTLLLLVLAYANPQGGKKEARAFTRDQNVVIALDLSQSMMATDVAPNRLERSKVFIYDLLQKLEGQRVALVVFAGDAYLHLPLTTDYSACALFVRNITTDMLPTAGTAIAPALERSMIAIRSGSYAGAPSSVVLISDGEDHDNGAVAMAKKLNREGIKVYTVGAGTSKGAPVPEPQQPGTMKRDGRGDVVISKLNQRFLKQVASDGGGEYYLTNAGNAVGGLTATINKVNSGKAEKASFSVRKEWYRGILIMALFVLVSGFFIQENMRKLIRIPGRALFLSLFMLHSFIAFSQSAGSTIRKGNNSYEKGNYVEAESSYQKAASKDSIDPRAKFNLGAAQYEQKKYDAAAQEFQKSIGKLKTPAQQADAWYNYGNSMYQQKKYKESLEAYKQSLRLNPAHNNARYNYAMAKKKLQEQQTVQQKNQEQQKHKQKPEEKKEPQKPDEKKQQDDKPQEPQQPSQATPSDKEIEQLLKAIDQEESKVQQKLYKNGKGGGKARSGKDW